jgi:Uncharacterized conserved protein (DUF2164)
MCVRRPSPRSSAGSRRTPTIQAAALLNFFIAEIGPSIYNQAVVDAQQRLQMRVAELDIECHADEFGYWRQTGRKR